MDANEPFATTRAWLLERAAAPEGFTPNAKGTVRLLKRLEMDGLVRQSAVYPVWMITNEGRSALKQFQIPVRI